MTNQTIEPITKIPFFWNNLLNPIILRTLVHKMIYERHTDTECETDLERWIYVLKNMETLKRLPFKARKSVFEKLEKIVDIAALSKEDREKYDESIKVYRDNLATIEFAEEKGRREGREEGRREESLKNAHKMKELGMNPEAISIVTGLTIEEINAL